jgi:hypothetical protein
MRKGSMYCYSYFVPEKENTDKLSSNNEMKTSLPSEKSSWCLGLKIDSSLKAEEPFIKSIFE